VNSHPGSRSNSHFHTNLLFIIWNYIKYNQLPYKKTINILWWRQSFLFSMDCCYCRMGLTKRYFSFRSGLRRRHRNTNRKGRSMDPGAHDIFVGQSGEEFYTQPLYQSSSELSSPNSETCYSFVRKAIQVSTTGQINQHLVGRHQT